MELKQNVIFYSEGGKLQTESFQDLRKAIKRYNFLLEQRNCGISSIKAMRLVTAGKKTLAAH